MSDTLSIEAHLRADTEAVFTALTDPAALRTWLADEADVDLPAEVKAQLIIDASPAEVFESLIDPKQVARWFGWEVEIEPRLGGKIAFGDEGKIIDFEPGRTLAYEDGDGAIVRWELEGSDGKTFLTFVETGYRDDELDNAAQHEAGWLGAIAELKRMHELGADWTPLTTELPAADDQPDPTP